MKRSLLPCIIPVLAVVLSGCFITRTPRANPVILSPGTPQIFTVRTFPAATTYQWLVDGVIDAGAAGNTYTYMLNDVLPSTHTITINATTSRGTDTYTWNIQYTGSNTGPTAAAGPDRSTFVADIVTLDGSGSTDPENNIVSWHWEQTGGPSAAPSDPNAAQTCITANVAAGSSLTYRLTVTDAGGLSSSDTCVVTVYDETWRMYRGDRQRTGQSPYNGPQTATLKWISDVGTYVHSSPAIGADGTVYVGEWALVDGSFASKLRALDGDTGAEMWSFTTGDWIWGGPAIGSNGMVYVGSDDCNVYALDGETGALKWTFTTGEYVESSPAIGADGTVYVGSWDGKLYALDGETGMQTWAYDTGSLVYGSPAIGTDGTVYVGDMNGIVHAVDGAAGTMIWTFAMGQPAGDQVWSSPAIGTDGTVYIGGYTSGIIYALNGATGALQWEYDAGSAIIGSPAAGADGSVIVATYYTGTITSLDGATGAVQWEFDTGSYVWSSPAIGADGTVYVGEVVPQQSPPASASRVLALDGDTGAVRWEYLTGDWVESSPAIGADGSLIIGGRDGKVYSFRD